MIAVGTCWTRSSNSLEEPPQRRPHDQAAGHREEKRRRHRTERKPMGGNSTYRQPIDHQGAGVVQQALAFEDGQQAMRRPQLAEHGRRGGGIGWRDDGAKRNRRRPWHRRYQEAGDDRNGNRRQADGKDDQAGDRRPVVFQIPR